MNGNQLININLSNSLCNQASLDDKALENKIPTSQENSKAENPALIVNITSKQFFSKDYFFGRINSNYLNYNLWDNDRYWKSTIDQVKKLQLKGRVLDIGCAFGFLLKRFKPYFNEIHGIDISDFAIQKAKKEAPFVQFNIIDLNNQELPFPDGYFNLITAFDVLEHTQSIEKSLQKIIPKLDKDGYLIISVPIKDTLAGKIFNFFNIDKSHVSVVSQNELYDIISKVGLEIHKKNYFFNAGLCRVRRIPVNVELVLKKIENL